MMPGPKTTPSEFCGNFYRRPPDLANWADSRREAALEPELPIVDAHHHLWDEAHRGRYLFDELLQDTRSGHNIVATVYIEAGSMYRPDGHPHMRPVGEVEFANGVAAIAASGHYGATRACAGIVAHADLTLGDQVQPVLEAMVAAGNGRFCGIRHSVPWDTGKAAAFYKRKAPRYQMLDPMFRKGFARLEPLGLSFDAWQFYPQLPDLADLLRAFPHTCVVLNHCGGLLGIPPHEKRDEVFSLWRENIRNLAQFPNLHVKIGGLGMMHCGWNWHLRDVPPSSEELAAAWRPYIETCIESFSAARCMMESNFPVDKQSCGYAVLWNALKRITSGCSASEKSALYQGTAAMVYRLTV